MYVFFPGFIKALHWLKKYDRGSRLNIALVEKYTIMSLLEVFSAKALSRSLLFPAILWVMGALKWVAAMWSFKQLWRPVKPHRQSPPKAIISKPGCRGCYCDPEYYMLGLNYRQVSHIRCTLVGN